MSDTDDHSGLPQLPPEEWLAAEYALGVLDGDARAQTEARIAREPAFARLIADWEERLTPWAAEIADVQPPPHLWEAIAARLPAEAAPRANPASTGVWQNLRFWRGLAFGSGALAAACLGALIYIGTFAPPAPAPLLASINGGGHSHFVATIDPTRGTIAVVPAAFAADATRVPELWLIPADGKPRPLGLLRADRAVTIAIPAALVPHARRDATLAVSLEPQGGSPTGQPTGPVIASGKLTTL
jgi:anti-sigma-K factor RskA